MQIIKELIIFVSVLYFSFGLELPENFKKCKRSENTSECLKVAIQDAIPKLEKGLPTFGFPPIDPLNIPSMTIGEGVGTVHVVQNYKNVNILGISAAKIENVKATIESDSIAFDIDVSIPNLTLQGEYDFNGRILVLPIIGKGKCTVILTQLKAKLYIKGEPFMKNDKKYMEIKGMKLELNPEKVIFNFENLFDGDQRLGAEMNNVLNENWKDVFNDIKFGYEEAIAIVIKSSTNTIFKKVPHSDMFAN